MLMAGSGCTQERTLESFGGPTMGSIIRWCMCATPHNEVEAILAEVDHQMSLWRSDSDLERFNALPANSCQTMPDAVLKLIGVGEQLSRDSDGAFDLTVKPLIDLWGLGAHALCEQLPSTRQLARARSTVGYRNVRIVGQQLCKSAAVQVDLNSIAAGYAVDRISQRMDALGLHDYLVQATGEVKVNGFKPDGSPWRITLDAPGEEGYGTQKVFPLNGYAVSTAGDYRRYAERHPRRLSDTLDALTGDTSLGADGRRLVLAVADSGPGARLELCARTQNPCFFCDSCR